MTIVLNGDEREVRDGMTAGELVDELSERGRSGVALAVNGEVVRRSDLDDCTFADGDRVELVGAVQGGAR